MWTAACRTCYSASLGGHLLPPQRLSVSIHWGPLTPTSRLILCVTGLESIILSCTFSLKGNQLLCRWIQKGNRSSV